MTLTPDHLSAMAVDFLMANTSPAQRALWLTACAARADMAGLQKLITADPALIRRAGEEALVAACGKGHLEIVKRLHALGTPIDICVFDDSNPSVTLLLYPLQYAFENGQWHVAQWLIDHYSTDKLVELSYLLARTVPAAPSLFRGLLRSLPYIPSLETPVAQRKAADVKKLAGALEDALETIAAGDRADFAAVLRAEGVSCARLYEAAMKKHSCAILQTLYYSGYRPDRAQMAVHMALLDGEIIDIGRAAQVRALVQAHIHADTHSSLDAALLQECRQALAQRFDALVAGEPAVIHLTRGGAFLREVAPMLMRDGAKILLLADCHGSTLVEMLQARGEVMQIFDPALWKGNFAAAATVHAGLPYDIRAEIDLGTINAAFGRYRLSRGMGPGSASGAQQSAKRFKIARKKPGGRE